MIIDGFEMPKFPFNPDITVASYCGLQTLAATLVSLRFAAPRYDAYCKIWV
jgi:hypothetical protein